MSRRNSVNDLDADFVYAFNGGNMTGIAERLRKRDGDEFALLDEAADEIERLRKALEMQRQASCDVAATYNEQETEIERLEHMQANLHGHIKRLEDENSKLRKESAIHASNTLAAIDDYNDALAENAKLREALEDRRMRGP